MSFVQPAFMVAHPASALSISSIAARNANTIADDSKRAWIDSRQGELGSFVATGADAGFTLTFGSTVSFGRCVIPAGHDFGTDECEVFNTGAGIPQGSSTAAGVRDMDLGSPSSSAFWGLQMPGSVATDVGSLGEFWLGDRKALTQGDARIDTQWEREYETEIERQDFGGRTATLELAPPRRIFSLRIRDLDPTNADFDTIEEVMTSGESRPFWYWSHDSTDVGPYLVRLTQAARRQQAFPVPQSKVAYEVRLEMREELT